MTIDRHDPDAAPALQDEFWGEQTDWTSSERRPAAPRARVGATIGRWWGGLLGAGSGVDRVHGEPTGDDLWQRVARVADTMAAEGGYEVETFILTRTETGARARNKGTKGEAVGDNAATRT